MLDTGRVSQTIRHERQERQRVVPRAQEVWKLKAIIAELLRNRNRQPCCFIKVILVGVRPFGIVERLAGQPAGDL